MNIEIPAHIFRAYDIRGLYNKDLTVPIMYHIGLAAGTYIKRILKGSEIVVGNDIRQSSIPLVHSFISGVLSTGVNIIYVGTTAFGQTLFAGWNLEKDAIAYITASHLPPEWNGIKFYLPDGVGFPEDELMKIRDFALSKEYTLQKWNEVGKISFFDPKKQYIDFFSKRLAFSKKLKVALDCGGASTTLSAPYVFEKLGFEIVPIFCDTDPTFSGRPSDPKPANLTKLISAVKSQGCNFGVAFDGDGDRAVIVDDEGKVLSADETGIIIGKYGFKENTGTIIINVECSKALKEQLEPLGYKIKQIPVGHTFLTIEAKQEKSPLGVESSGHIIIPEFFLFDDALVTPLKIAQILDKHSERLSTLVNLIPTYPIKKFEIDCNDENKFRAVENLKQEIVKEFADVNTLDGIRIELDTGWVLIRASNTSPMIRMTIEADSNSIIEEMANNFGSRLKNEIKKLTD